MGVPGPIAPSLQGLGDGVQPVAGERSFVLPSVPTPISAEQMLLMRHGQLVDLVGGGDRSQCLRARTSEHWCRYRSTSRHVERLAARMRYRRLLLILLQVAWRPRCTQAPVEDWRTWALRMEKAQQSLNYDATMVIDSGSGDWELVELSQRVARRARSSSGWG